jgi:TusA-related sulfurtransferase
MRMHTVAGVLASLTLALGCGPKPAAVPATGPVGELEQAMSNCPSAVDGATTTMRSIDGGVVLDIVAPDPGAAAEIVEVARKNAALGEPDAARGMHTGQHGGPGADGAGFCPVIHVGTTVTAEEIAGGARMTVIANDPAAAADLQGETRERLSALDPAMHER